MGETGVVRFPGGLDPKAQEFRPRTNTTAAILPHQMHLFVPVLPPPPPSPPVNQVYYPYAAGQALPFGDVYNHQYPAPAGYVSTVPSLPPQSAVPTRTLVMSSVPSDVSESIIRRELEVFGEVRGVGMERISDGIVTVYFYDLRHAEMALKEIREQHMHQQNRLRNLFAAEGSSGFLGLGDNNFLAPVTAARGLIAGCAVWAQFIIPSCNAVPDGHNHGTIVVFNLDPNISSPSLKEIFQAFGAIKELRETPLKKQQRFVEFYDTRDAAKALREMNGKEIHGKQVVIEFSRPGGFSRKFFNATTTSNKSSSITNRIIKSRISRFTSQYQSLPSPPPPPPPPPRRFSGRPPLNIPPRGFLKESSNFSNVNPNGSFRTKSTDEATVGVGCLSICGGGNRDGDANGLVADKITDAPVKIRNMKKCPIDESNSKQQHNNRNRPWKSRQGKKFDTRFLINEEAMVEANCSDSRTTVMIKNIPNKYSQKLLLNMLDNHCIHCNEQIAEGGGDQPLSSYDFLYLPIDFNNKCNVGYGFVNMTSPQATWRLYKAFHHQHWEVFNSRKICEVTYARVQGLEALKEHFKNSKFPCEMDHYLPVVFSPPRDGRQLSEPEPVVGQKQHLDSLRNSDDDEEENLSLSLNKSISISNSSSNGGDMVDEEDKVAVAEGESGDEWGLINY
ncbi:protein terminal ear1-like [Euphorbia lathyris]|uniref:protein terminal ear1-like n=1 Tax=Euphorbia lathyris TaxID=212925 RepID=UPI0033133DCE